MNTMIRFYQVAISPLLGKHCRFYPSCSEYSRQAFQSRGFLTALFLTAARILKCNPLHPGGVDTLE